MLSHTIHSYSKYTINLNVRIKMIKLSEENIGMNLHNLELGKHKSPRAQVIIGKNDNCTLSKLNTFAFQSY